MSILQVPGRGTLNFITILLTAQICVPKICDIGKISYLIFYKVCGWALMGAKVHLNEQSKWTLDCLNQSSKHFSCFTRFLVLYGSLPYIAFILFLWIANNQWIRANGSNILFHLVYLILARKYCFQIFAL